MKKLKSSQFLICCILSGFVLTTIAIAQDGSPSGKCKFQTLTASGQEFITAQGNNDVGAIVGVFHNGSPSPAQGFLLFNGKISTFSFPGSMGTQAFDINNHAQIVGFYTDQSNADHGFVVHSGGFKAINVPASLGDSTHGAGINDRGDVVGTFTDATQRQVHGFLLHNGQFKVIDFPTATATLPTGINNQDVIVGRYIDSTSSNLHGFRFVNGVFTSIDVPGATETEANAINEEGDVVGDFRSADGVVHGFSLDRGNFRVIDDPNATGKLTSLTGVNNQDKVVGIFNTMQLQSSTFRANCQNVF